MRRRLPPGRGRAARELPGHAVEPLSAQGLADFLERQAAWTAGLRARVYSMLPLRSAGRVVEVGCGPGSVLRELASLTPACVTGLDRDPSLLAAAADRCPEGVELVEMDVLESSLPPAGIYLFHHFLAHVADLPRLLRRVRRALIRGGGGMAAVLAEYDWTGASSTPPGPLPSLLAGSLEAGGLHLRSAPEVESAFEGAGFRRCGSGLEPGRASPPDEWFAEHQAAVLEEAGDGDSAGALRSCSGVCLAVPVMWSVWRTAVSGLSRRESLLIRRRKPS